MLARRMAGIDGRTELAGGGRWGGERTKDEQKRHFKAVCGGRVMGQVACISSEDEGLLYDEILKDADREAQQPGVLHARGGRRGGKRGSRAGKK